MNTSFEHFWLRFSISYYHFVFLKFQLGDLVFNVNGSGQPPVQSNDHVIRSSIAGSSSTIISFENPFEEDILVNVDLQEKPPSKTGKESFAIFQK